VSEIDRLGQATHIEQSRAVAEVQGAIIVAQHCPRNILAAQDAMRDSCGRKYLAERAFYRYPRGGKSVTGPTVHLARELARCWGNFQYGFAEMRRDDANGISEMQAWAWDVQTNTRSSQIFIVPHYRDKNDRSGDSEPVKLVTMRDIYESNANQGARRLREAIFSLLPPWFVEEAKELCHRTMAGPENVPRVERIKKSLASFRELGVTDKQIYAKYGRGEGNLSDMDLAQLGVIFRSIERGEISIEDEFPLPRLTNAEVLGTDKAIEK
jgi:hypothetical protein